jgi:hypothetical protein
MLVKPKLWFPSTLVTLARQNHHLQEQHHPAAGQARYRDAARPCPGCGCPASRLAWIYYRSEAWTWPAGCGTGGWLTLCDDCHVQVDYFLEELSEHGRLEPVRVQPPAVTA